MARHAHCPKSSSATDLDRRSLRHLLLHGDRTRYNLEWSVGAHLRQDIRGLENCRHDGLWASRGLTRAVQVEAELRVVEDAIR
jgi:hypothetical protein